MTKPDQLKTWETPKVVNLGSMPELTQENAKLAGSFDGEPFADCPPGQFRMGGCS